ncbi:hypothetical protein DFH28DRAFT_893220 [Melampsora americana]|nr:hypothetical protein DFH28DRAFT_893220 [Melampsora americana]
MVNRKTSQAPLTASECRIDVMSRAIETRSYKQALMGERATINPCAFLLCRFGTPPCTPSFGLTSTVAPRVSQGMTNPPLTSPFEARPRPPSTFLTPSMSDLGFGIRPGTASTGSSSAATAVTSKNPHINPLIFDSPGLFQHTSLGSPSTVCTSPTKYPSPSKKRPAKAIELDSDSDLDMDEQQAEVTLPDDGKPPFLSHDRVKSCDLTLCFCFYVI